MKHTGTLRNRLGKVLRAITTNAGLLLCIICMYCLLCGNKAQCKFTVRAETEQVVNVPQKLAEVISYMRNAENYSRFYPNIIRMTPQGNAQYEWAYQIGRPLQSPFEADLTMHEREDGPAAIIFEGADSLSHDYLYCRASAAAIGDTATRLDVDMRIVLPRENGTDFGMLAPLLGADFVSARSRDVLARDLALFLQRAIANMGEMRRK